ncbi:hypothetical protein D3C74_305710 [compost metagenome]
MQKDVIRRKQHHKQRRARFRGQLLQAVGFRSVKEKLQRLAFVALHGRTRIVGRHFQHRKLALEHVQPVRLLTLKPFLLLLRMLPNGVVFVLNAQRLQLLAAVQADEFFNKDFHRDAVGNNMMHVVH